jgi:tetratricopeptide (TPR) repeat protein
MDRSNKSVDQVAHDGGAGHTQWDAVIEIVRLLGRAAPYILILSASVFAVYKYIELSQQIVTAERKAQSEAQKIYQDQLANANERLIKTYTAMGEISGTQINNLKDMFALHAQTTGRIQKLQESEEALRREVEQQRTKLEEQESQLKDTEAKKQELGDELKALEANLDSATATLGALGTLVDEAPDLLRAVATTDAVQIVLQKADRLLGEQNSGPEVQQNRVQILLAFADLQGFIGAAESQEKLARGALTLVEQLRASGQVFSGIDAAAAAAHATLGVALAFQEKFEGSLNELTEAIRQFDLALAKTPADMRLVRRKADVLEKLGATIYAKDGEHDKALGPIKKALELWRELLQREPDNPAHKQSLAWSHFQIGEVESEEQDFDVAFEEYEAARRLMDELADRVYRSNEWLDRKAQIYTGSALVLGDRVRFAVRDREINSTSSEQEAKVGEALSQALSQLEEALKITEGLSRDQKNWAWQSSHGTVLHQLGTLKFLRWLTKESPDDLDQSIADLDRSLQVWKKITGAQPTQREWASDARWAQTDLNEALAHRARRDGNYRAMRDLFSKNVDILKQLVKEPYTDDWHYQLRNNQVSVVDASVMMGEASTAYKDYSDVKDEAQKLLTNAAQGSRRQRWDQLIAIIDRRLANLSVQSRSGSK